MIYISNPISFHHHRLGPSPLSYGNHLHLPLFLQSPLNALPKGLPHHPSSPRESRSAHGPSVLASLCAPPTPPSSPTLLCSSNPPAIFAFPPKPQARCSKPQHWLFCLLECYSQTGTGLATSQILFRCPSVSPWLSIVPNNHTTCLHLLSDPQAPITFFPLILSVAKTASPIPSVLHLCISSLSPRPGMVSGSGRLLVLLKERMSSSTPWGKGFLNKPQQLEGNFSSCFPSLLPNCSQKG